MRTVPCEDYGELREELDAALTRLPADLRDAVVLRYLEGRDGPEAARVAGCNANTFRWRTMKGLDRLSSLLAQRKVVFSIGGLTAFLASEGRERGDRRDDGLLGCLGHGRVCRGHPGGPDRQESGGRAILDQGQALWHGPRNGSGRRRRCGADGGEPGTREAASDNPG